jgi:PAS domain S-box
MDNPGPVVLAERIRQLFRLFPPVLAANVINAALVVVALWSPEQWSRLIAWAAALAVLTTVRTGLWVAYRYAHPTDDRMPVWGYAYTVCATLSGLLWGCTALLFIRSGDPVSLMLVAFVIGGMASGAVTGAASYLPAFYLYLFASTVPLALRLVMEGNRTTLAMAVMVVVFTVGLVIIGRLYNIAFTRQLQLAHEKQQLLESRENEIRDRTAELQRANARLTEEVAERQRAQEMERQMSEKVAHTARRFEAILSNTTDHVFMMGRSGALLFMSASALRDFAIDEGVTGKTWIDLGVPVNAATALQRMHGEVMRTGAVVTGEIIHRIHDRLRHYEYKFSPLAEADGDINAVIVVARDITDRRSVEQAQEEARAAAERADHAKSRFLAAASHDLRQPMQSMFLFANALAPHVSDAKGRDMLTMVERGLDTLKSLLDSLLDISRLDVDVLRPNLAPFDVGVLVEEIAVSHRPLAIVKGLDLTVRTEASVVVRSDANLLGRMVRNLVENAIRYTETGSVQLAVRREGEQAWIDVRDTGIGIAPDQVERIFEEFHQIGNPERDKSRGLGLGLAIVQRLSTILGHPVEVWSEPGSGSCFSIRVMVDDSASLPTELREVPSPSTPTVGRLAVLIDDDTSVLLGLRAIFQEWGFETVIAGSGELAVEQLRAAPRQPDIIVADYRLRSGQVGTHAIQMINAAFRATIPGIILTGETGAECADDVEQQGFGFVQKPVAPVQLADTLERILTARSSNAGNGPSPDRQRRVDDRA